MIAAIPTSPFRPTVAAPTSMVSERQQRTEQMAQELRAAGYEVHKIGETI